MSSSTSRQRRAQLAAKRANVANPIELALWGAQRITDAERQQLTNDADRVFQALRTGHGSAAAWQQMADVCNLAEAVITIGIGTNLVPSVDASQDALRNLMHRVHAGGCWTLYPAEITAIQEVIDVYDAQLQICSHREFKTAVEMVRRKVAGALAGNTGGRHVVHAEPLDKVPQPLAQHGQHTPNAHTQGART